MKYLQINAIAIITHSKQIAVIFIGFNITARIFYPLIPPMAVPYNLSQNNSKTTLRIRTRKVSNTGSTSSSACCMNPVQHDPTASMLIRYTLVIFCVAIAGKRLAVLSSRSQAATSLFAPADILLLFKLLSVFTPFFPPFLLFPPPLPRLRSRSLILLLLTCKTPGNESCLRTRIPRIYNRP